MTNETIFYFFNNLAGQNLNFDSLVLFIAEPFGIILIFGLLFFLFAHEHKGQGIRHIAVVLSAAVAAWIISKIIKYLYFSPRPFVALDGINVLFEHGGNDSMPSGHATFFSALSVAVFFYHRILGLLYILGAILIGLSRIVAGVHWPLDILAGYILGGCIAYSVYRIYNRV